MGRGSDKMMILHNTCKPSTTFIKYFQASNQQHISNQLACRAVSACAGLGGYSDNTPENPAVKASLSALLTPYLARKLSNPDPTEVRSCFLSLLIFSVLSVLSLLCTYRDNS